MKNIIIHCSFLPVFTAKFNKFKCKKQMTQVGNFSPLLLKFAEKVLWFQPEYLSLSLMFQRTCCIQTFSPSSKLILHCFLFSYLIFIRYVQDWPLQTHLPTCNHTHTLHQHMKKTNRALSSILSPQCLHYEFLIQQSGWSLTFNLK